AATIVGAMEQRLLEERVHLVGERLGRAEALVEVDATRGEVGALMAEARSISPRRFAEARERVARIAAKVYRARAAAGRTDARDALDEVVRLGPINGAEYAAARRDARIAEARAVASSDLERALGLLGAQGGGLPADPVSRAAAR